MTGLEPSEDALHEFFGESFDKVKHFAELLRSRGDELGLLGPNELDRLWSRHIVNSAALLECLPDEGSVIDLGSGAGLPGVVVACLRPDLDVELVEPMERRAEWLKSVRKELDLDNVSVTRARAEELAGEREADVVSCRALAAMRTLAGWAAPLLKTNGLLLALKGARAEEELGNSVKQLKKARLGSVRIIEARPMEAVEPTRIVYAVKE